MTTSTRPSMAAQLRRRVDLETYANWRAAMPGLVVPLDLGDSDWSEDTDPVVPPPDVAAALAVHADSAASVVFAAGVAGDVMGGVVGCVSIGHTRRCPGLASSLVTTADTVEIALVPLAVAVEEVLKFLPTAPRPGLGVSVQVRRRGRPAPRWLRTWATEDGRDLAAFLSGLADDLRGALAGSLAAGAQ